MTLTLYSATGSHDSDLKALEALGIAKIRSAQEQPFKPTATTCRWIEDQPSFTVWQNGRGSQKLWISGALGTGKTYLSRHIVELVGSDGDIAYCSLNNIVAGYKTAKSVLVWLMYEILTVRRELIDKCLTGPYERDRASNGDSVCDWPFSQVKQVWKSLMRVLKRPAGGPFCGTIVVDGIDQCLGGQDHDELTSLKQFFGCITKDDGFRLLVFSRPSTDLSDIQVTRGFSGHLMVETDTQKDITTTVKETARWIARSHNYDSRTKQKIVAKVTAKAKGMYLWATMVLEEMRRQPLSASDLEEFLNQLPSDIIELYDFLLGRAGTPSTDRSGSVANGGDGFARHVLFWIAYQLCGMNEDELCTGVSLTKAIGLPQRNPTRRITEADVRAIPDGTNLERDISRSCGALVVFTEDDTFAPAHPSVQQFLVTPTEVLKQRCPRLKHHQDYYCGDLRPDRIIRQICTNYLLLPRFSDPRNDEPCATPTAWAARVNKRVDQHPFSRYAARNWLKHASMSDQRSDINGNRRSTKELDQQRLQTMAAGESSDWKCSRSWMEIWWYYERPGLDFPLDGVSLDSLHSGARPPARLQWVGTLDHTVGTGNPATGSPASRMSSTPPSRPQSQALALMTPSTSPPSREPLRPTPYASRHQSSHPSSSPSSYSSLDPSSHPSPYSSSHPPSYSTSPPLSYSPSPPPTHTSRPRPPAPILQPQGQGSALVPPLSSLPPHKPSVPAPCSPQHPSVYPSSHPKAFSPAQEQQEAQSNQGRRRRRCCSSCCIL